MVIIFWTGRGWVVPVFVFGLCLVTEVLVRATMHSDVYYQQHRWPMSVAFVASGLIIFGLSTIWKIPPPRKLVDPKTGQPVMLVHAPHKFFFLNIKYWGVLLVCFGLFCLLPILPITDAH